MKVNNLNFRAKIVVNSRYNLNNFWWSEIHLNQVSKGYPTKVFKVKEFLIQLKFFRNRIWYSVCLLWLLKVGGKGSTCFRCNFDSTEVVALPKLFPSFDDYCKILHYQQSMLLVGLHSDQIMFKNLTEFLLNVWIKM